MTDAPLVEFIDVEKAYGAPHALRVRSLRIQTGDRVALGGFDQAAAEVLISLITGASLPDGGTVRVGGRDTRDIATDTEWLTSLDQFGIVTARAVLIGALPVAANLALPLTLSIDPMSPETRSAVEDLADLVRLPRERLLTPASTLGPGELVQVHLARALALRPELVLLEHPTSAVGDVAIRRALGETLRAAAGAHGAGWLALTDDRAFARASGSTELTLTPSTGVVRREGIWRRLVRRG